MQNDIKEIVDKGFCIIKGALSPEKVSEINAEIDHYINKNHTGIIYEKESDKVRSIHGPHLFEPYFYALTKSPRFVDICKITLHEDVYIHQVKINMKQALKGESWPWHQDYIFWQKGDHIPSPQLMNVAIFLNEMSLLNGPLCVIPKSHLHGDICEKVEQNTGNWQVDVSVNLSYQARAGSLRTLIENNGVEFIVAELGDILVFHPQLVHCSLNNLSVDDRRLLIITYNSVKNLPIKESTRPDFLSSRNYEAVS